MQTKLPRTCYKKQTLLQQTLLQQTNTTTTSYYTRYKKTVAFLISYEQQYYAVEQFINLNDAQVKNIEMSPFFLAAEDLGHTTLSKIFRGTTYKHYSRDASRSVETGVCHSSA